MNLMLISLFFALVSAKSSVMLTEKIEARVGSQIITSTDLNIMMERMKQDSDASSKTIRAKALDFLVDQALIEQYLDRMQMSVTSREVDQQVDAIRTSNGISNTDDFRNLLKAQGMGFQAFRQNLKNQLERTKFYQLIRRQTLLTITDNDLKSYYSKNQNQFSNNYEVELQECLIPYDDKEKLALQLAREFQKKPKKFGECVNKHSQSPSATSDGKIGSFKQGQLREDISNKVFPLETGEVALIKLPGAVQLLKIISKKDHGPIEFSEVKDQLKQAYEQEVMTQEFKRQLSELRIKTNIKTASLN